MKARESVDYLLLGSLAAGPKHGYEILQFLEQHFGPAWYVGNSQLYTVLKRLERKRLVSSEVRSQENRPAKRVFSLTAAGRSAFQAWLGKPVKHIRDMRVEFNAKLFFAGHMETPVLRRLIAAQQDILNKTSERIRSRLQKEPDGFSRLILSSKLAMARSWTEWLHESVEPYIETFGGTVHG